MASPRLQDLKRQRARAIALRDRLKRQGKHALAEVQERRIRALTREIIEAKQPGRRPAPKGGRRSIFPTPTRRVAPDTMRRVRPGEKDPYATTPITVRNAVQMVKHYRALVWATPIFTPLRAKYERRLAEARRAALARAVAGDRSANRPTAARRLPPAKTFANRVGNLQRARDKAVRRKDYAAVQRFDEEIARAQRLQNASAMQAGPAYAPPSDVTAPYIVDRRGESAASTSEDDPDFEVSTTTSVDLPDDPWYKRYALWLGLAAIGGAAYAVSRRKGKGGAKSFRAVIAGPAPRRKRRVPTFSAT